MSLLSYAPSSRVFWPELDYCVNADTQARELSFRVDLREEDNRFLLLADLPGVRPEDLSVTLEKGRLTVSGEKKDPAEGQTPLSSSRERRFGKFSRSFELNGLVEESAVEATFQAGVLTLSLPKKEALRARQVTVRNK